MAIDYNLSCSRNFSVHEGQETEDELAESIARRRLNPPIAIYIDCENCCFVSFVGARSTTVKL